ncbi:hypothetical protein ACA910_006245 [Epithemia clementina (nom. ined.)]
MVIREIIKNSLIALAVWLLLYQRKTYPCDIMWMASKSSPLSLSLTTAKWWEPYIAKSQQNGPMMIYPLPLNVCPSPNAILDVFKHIGVMSHSYPNGEDTVTTPVPNTVIDIGLPTNLLDYAQKGFRVQGFEARKSAYNQVLEQVELRKLQHLITIHHTALSNCSNQTMEIFDVDDSSSLLKTVILGGGAKAERQKFESRGQKRKLFCCKNWMTLQPTLWVSKLIRKDGNQKSLWVPQFC